MTLQVQHYSMFSINGSQTHQLFKIDHVVVKRLVSFMNERDI